MLSSLLRFFPGSVKVKVLYWVSMLPLRLLRWRGVKPYDSGQALGTSIIRYYWDRFLAQHQADIQGVGLEIGNPATLRHYGGRALAQGEAVDLGPGPEVTWVADLSLGWPLPEARYDVFINQYSLHVIEHDLDALYHSIRVLKPGGVLLANFVCQSTYLNGQAQGTTQVWHWYTPAKVRQMLAQLGLEPAHYQIITYGSYAGLLTYILDLPTEAMPAAELARHDPECPLLVAVRAQRPAQWQPPYQPRP
jgi:SAM-dependent methyltransferase